MPTPQREDIDVVELFGEFQGAELTVEECEIKAIQHIERKIYQGHEAKLFSTKWFDYRHLHPTKATYLYAAAYMQAYSSEMQVRFDVVRGKYMLPLKGAKDDIFNAKSRDYTALWKGRQAADSLGIPYDFYCRAVMRWAEESGWRYLPRSAQMYSTKVKDMMHDAWLEECKIRTILPSSEFYRADRFEGHPDQIAFRMHLKNTVLSREHPELLLNRLIERDRALDQLSAIEMFGKDLVAACNTISIY